MKKLGVIDLDVLDIEEHEDGSATVKFGFDPETLHFIIRVGLRKILMDSLEENERDA